MDKRNKKPTAKIVKEIRLQFNEALSAPLK